MEDEFEGQEFESDEGYYDEEAEITDDYYDEGDDGEEGSDDNPWSWADEVGAKPEDVKKTWNQYTQTREEVLAERREAERLRNELDPIVRLRDEILADPGLVSVIDDYMTNSRPADRAVVDLQQEVSALRSQIETDREYEEVMSFAREKGLPTVDKRELLTHAIETRSGSLMSAYKDKMFDQVGDKAVQKVTDGIKRSRGAGSIRTPRRDKAGGRASIKDIASMSDAEFEKNYGAIVSRYQSK